MSPFKPNPALDLVPRAHHPRGTRARLGSMDSTGTDDAMVHAGTLENGRSRH